MSIIHATLARSSRLVSSVYSRPSTHAVGTRTDRTNVKCQDFDGMCVKEQDAVLTDDEMAGCQLTDSAALWSGKPRWRLKQQWNPLLSRRHYRRLWRWPRIRCVLDDSSKAFPLVLERQTNAQQRKVARNQTMMKQLGFIQSDKPTASEWPYRKATTECFILQPSWLWRMLHVVMAWHNALRHCLAQTAYHGILDATNSDHVRDEVFSALRFSTTVKTRKGQVALPILPWSGISYYVFLHIGHGAPMWSVGPSSHLSIEMLVKSTNRQISVYRYKTKTPRNLTGNS